MNASELMADLNQGFRDDPLRRIRKLLSTEKS